MVTAASPLYRQRLRLKLAAIVGVELAYIGVRALIYSYMPLKNGVDWFIRDTAMDIPRVVGLALVSWLGVRFWGARGIGFHGGGGIEALRWGLPWIAIAFVPEFFLPYSFNYGPFALATEAVNCFLFVAIFEETLFRGALVNAFADIVGPWSAITLSALLFTVFHLQAVPFIEWPNLFMNGMFFGLLRRQGVGLPWLIFLHGTFDTLFYLGPHHYGDLSLEVRAVSYGALALFILACTRSLGKKPFETANGFSARRPVVKP